MCGHFPFVHCHSERSEESEVCEWFMCNEFRFFTSLRCVQNDRGRDAAFGMIVKGCCVRDDRIGKPSLFKLYMRLSAPEGEGTTWLESACANKVSNCAALDEVLAVDAGAGQEYVGYLPQVGNVVEGVTVDY